MSSKNHEAPLTVQFSPVSSHFLSLSYPDIILITLPSNTLSLRSSLSVRDQVSHSYTATSKFMDFYNLIFTFLHSKWE